MNKIQPGGDEKAIYQALKKVFWGKNFSNIELDFFLDETAISSHLECYSEN